MQRIQCLNIDELSSGISVAIYISFQFFCSIAQVFIRSLYIGFINFWCSVVLMGQNVLQTVSGYLWCKVLIRLYTVWNRSPIEHVGMAGTMFF